MAWIDQYPDATATGASNQHLAVAFAALVAASGAAARTDRGRLARDPRHAWPVQPRGGRSLDGRL